VRAQATRERRGTRELRLGRDVVLGTGEMLEADRCDEGGEGWKGRVGREMEVRGRVGQTKIACL
jgi:hypothetical protein